VPGVLLLELVVAALGRGAPSVLTRVKFLRAVLPGEAFVLRWKSTGPQVSFRGERGTDLIIEGSLEFGASA